MSPLVQKQVYQPHTQPGEKKRIKQSVYKSRITKGEKLIYMLALAGVVFAFYLVLSNYASIYMANHQIQQKELEIRDQLSVNEGLGLQVMELSDPVRILSEAEKMGMVLNEDSVIFTHD